MKKGGRGSKFFIFLIVLFLSLTLWVPGVFAENLELTVGNVTGTLGETLQVPVNLTSTGQVVMLQFDLSYNNQLLDFKSVSLGDELQSKFLVDSNMVDGKQRLMIYNTSLQHIPGGEQTIALLIFEVTTDIEPGQYCSLDLDDAVISDEDTNDISAQATINNGRFAMAAPVTGVSLNKNSLTLIAGGAPETLTAIVEPFYATNKNVIWTSGDQDENVLCISEDGLTATITPLAEGSATITVTTEDGGKTAVCNVTVNSVDETTGLILSVESISALPGEVVQVPVNLTSTGQVVMLQFDLSYNNEVLTFKSVSLGDEYKSNFMVDSNMVDGKQRVMIYNTSLKHMPQGNQTLALLTFEVANNAEARQYCPLQLDNVVISDEGNNDIASQVVVKNGQFFLTEGDLNGDGHIDIADLTIVAQAYGTTNFQADLSGDGTVDIFDLVMMSRTFTE